MMNPRIDAIFFDVGDTLRRRVADDALQAQAPRQLAALLGSDESPDELCARLEENYRAYRKWANATLIEAREVELWTRWMLPDAPRDQIAPLAEQLTRLWRQRSGNRLPRHDTRQVIIELHRRGYALGIISNTISEHDVPAWLERDGLTQYFRAVILSASAQRRKPDPEIFLHATRCANVAPNHSAYVGDRPSRDVLGSQRAGFAMAIIIAGNGLEKDKAETNLPKPDLVIHELSELLNLFAPRRETNS